MNSNTLYKLISNFFSNTLPEETQRAFRRWWISDSHSVEKDETMETIWDQIEVQADASTYKELEKLHVRIQADNKRNKNSYIQRIVQIAACLLLPLAGGFISYFIIPKDIQYIEPVWAEHFVHNGEKDELILADGTKVWLNSGSILLYSSEFEGKERQIYLNGEAIFDVAKDPDRPFIVKTHHLEVEVLGTIFNLKTYADSDLSSVTLEEGSLKVRTREEEEQLFYLRPDEQVIFNHISGESYKEDVNANRILQWKNGYLIFRNNSFDEIIKTLERQFDVAIRYESQRFAGRTFTMRFTPDEDISQILEVMKEMIKGMSYHIKENTIYIN